MIENNCLLCEAVHNEPWLDYYAGFAIIKTKNMKGHSKRCMVLSSKHKRELGEQEVETATAFLFRYLSSVHRDHDWAIMDSTHASIPEHWHMVATTINENAK